MIKAMPATDVKPVYFEWDAKFKVLIQDVPQNMRQQMIRMNEEISFNKNHQKTTDTNWVNFGRAYMREALAGWIGMTYRYLIEICQPIELEKGIKLDDPIEFNQEHLEFVIKNHNSDFSGFMTGAASRLNGIYAEQKKKELENLERTSGGK